MHAAKPRYQRFTIITLLAFSSGLPLALSGSVLQAWYTVSGVSLMSIGLLTLVHQPYVYKFLWAPFSDRFVPFKLGRRRSWLLLAQLALALTLFAMGMLSPTREPLLLAGLALALAFFSATQDIVFDAYRTEILYASEYGIGASLNTIGYRFAMIVAGAIGLILADHLGWRFMYSFMAVLMLLEVLVTLKAPRPESASERPASFRLAVVLPFKEFMTRPYAGLMLLFIVIYKLSDVFVLSLNSVFILRHLGFSLTVVGSIGKTVGLGASLLGTVVAGFLFKRLGLYRALFAFGVFQCLTNLGYLALACVGKSLWLYVLAHFLEMFGTGLSAVAFVAFLMVLCDQRYTATQFALFSALGAVGLTYVGPLAAFSVQHVGWIWFYFGTVLVGIPALLLLRWLHQRLDFNKQRIPLREDTCQQKN